MSRKKIGQSEIIGQQGINIIEEVVLSMGFLWYATGGVEAGIDGIIEIRDFQTGEVTNCILQVHFKKNSTEVAYYRHSAFEGQFIRVDSDWFLEITPTYFFTRDGYTREKFEKEHLSGIKRLEKNPAVFGQLIMWAEYLITPAQGDLFIPNYPFLQFFDQLEEFEIEVGIDDDIWLRNEDDETTALLEESLNDLPLFKINNED